MGGSLNIFLIFYTTVIDFNILEIDALLGRRLLNSTNYIGDRLKIYEKNDIFSKEEHISE